MQRRSQAAAARTPVLPPGGLLDWSASWHFMSEARPCRHCGAPTHLRDAKGPADKVCAERALAEIDRIVQAHSGQERL
jgi:hypothetical protein